MRCSKEDRAGGFQSRCECKAGPPRVSGARTIPDPVNRGVHERCAEVALFIPEVQEIQKPGVRRPILAHTLMRMAGEEVYEHWAATHFGASCMWAEPTRPRTWLG
jgi:hypothetical protein